MVHKAKNIYYLALCREALPTAGLKRHSLWLRSPFLKILAKSKHFVHAGVEERVLESSFQVLILFLVG